MCVCVCVWCNNIQAGIMYNQRVMIAIIFWVSLSWRPPHYFFSFISALGRRNKRRAQQDKRSSTYFVYPPPPFIFKNQQKSRWNRKPTDSFLFKYTVHLYDYSTKQENKTKKLNGFCVDSFPNRAYQDLRYPQRKLWAKSTTSDRIDGNNTMSIRISIENQYPFSLSSHTYKQLVRFFRGA